MLTAGLKQAIHVFVSGTKEWTHFERRKKKKQRVSLPCHPIPNSCSPWCRWCTVPNMPRHQQTAGRGGGGGGVGRRRRNNNQTVSFQTEKGLETRPLQIRVNVEAQCPLVAAVCSCPDTHEGRAPPLDGAGALLPPGPPQQETQQVEHEHGGLGESAEEGLVVVLSLEDVLPAERQHRGRH